MNRMVGIRINDNKNTGFVGVMKYVTGDVNDTTFFVKRNGNEALTQRYFVKVGKENVNLHDYVEYNELERLENMYLNQMNFHSNGFITLHLKNWYEQVA